MKASDFSAWQDHHVHSTFSDGKNTPEEMAEAALQAGLTLMGFAEHALTAFDPRGCLTVENTPLYRETVAALKEKYDGRMTVLCGIEQDYYAETPAVGYDFVIGSVHYVEKDGVFHSIDEEPADWKRIADEAFGGDAYAFIEAYYRTVADVVRKTGADIVGHLDLIAKFNRNGALFDESHPRYRAAWQQAVDRLLPTGAVFEINFGAVTRGYRSEPYPAAEIRDYIRAHGGRFCRSSDAHDTRSLIPEP